MSIISSGERSLQQVQGGLTGLASRENQREIDNRNLAESNKQGIAGIGATIGAAAGTVAGAYVGGPVGAAIGGQLGGAAGGFTTSLFQ